MKALKIISVALALLLLASVAFIGYLYYTAQVAVIYAESGGSSVSEHEIADFEKSLRNDSFCGTVFRKPESWKAPSEYVWLTYRVQLKNNCLVPIDRVEVQVIPDPADVLQPFDSEVHTVPARTDGEISVSVLSEAGTHPVRELVITFYVWGKPFSLRTTAGG